jgi:hypothetical protein
LIDVIYAVSKAFYWGKQFNGYNTIDVKDQTIIQKMKELLQSFLVIILRDKVGGQT